MNRKKIEVSFQQIHIDIARNATDDFNLFHDPHQWHKISNNPFEGPIVLGFQLESLIEDMLYHYRIQNDELKVINENNLVFSNYQFTFANAVKPGQKTNVDIKKSQLKKTDENIILSNRIAVKTDDQLTLMGYKKESVNPLFLAGADFSNFGNLTKQPDRSSIAENHFFLKRKFMNTSNAKNFLCSCFADQSRYFDELNDKANFPEIFPCSLISCALLEKALKNGHDFIQDPMVYTTHKISLNRKLLGQLKSNDALHILIRKSEKEQNAYDCYGLMHDNQILYRGIIGLTSLQSILK